MTFETIFPITRMIEGELIFSLIWLIIIILCFIQKDFFIASILSGLPTIHMIIGFMNDVIIKDIYFDAIYSEIHIFFSIISFICFLLSIYYEFDVKKKK